MANDGVQKLIDRICASPVPLALFRKEKKGVPYISVARHNSDLCRRTMAQFPEKLIGVYDVEVDYRALTADLNLMGV